MLIGVPAETLPGETRVAVTPETAKKLKAQGHTVRVQSGAGVAASVPDAAYEAVGAEITDAAGAYGADIVLKVRCPQDNEMSLARSGGVLMGMLNPFDASGLQRLASAGLTSFALESAPRTSRAQSMDVLSSQANIAGYKAVIMAADRYQRFFPMLMTAAGTVKAARVVILGVGVAGRQGDGGFQRLADLHTQALRERLGHADALAVAGQRVGLPVPGACVARRPLLQRLGPCRDLLQQQLTRMLARFEVVGVHAGGLVGHIHACIPQRQPFQRCPLEFAVVEMHPGLKHIGALGPGLGITGVQPAPVVLQQGAVEPGIHRPGIRGPCVHRCLLVSAQAPGV